MPESYGELEELRRENARLRKLLKLTETEAAPARGTQAVWFDRGPGTVDANSSPDAKVAFYAALLGRGARRIRRPLGEPPRAVGLGSCP